MSAARTPRSSNMAAERRVEARQHPQCTLRFAALCVLVALSAMMLVAAPTEGIPAQLPPKLAVGIFARPGRGAGDYAAAAAGTAVRPSVPSVLPARRENAPKGVIRTTPAVQEPALQPSAPASLNAGAPPGSTPANAGIPPGAVATKDPAPNQNPPEKPVATKNPAPNQNSPEKPVAMKDPAPNQNSPEKPVATKDPAPNQNSPEKPVAMKDPAPNQNPPKPVPTKDFAPNQNSPEKPVARKDPAPNQNPPKPVPTKDPAPKQNPPKPAPTKDPAPKQNPPKPAPTKDPAPKQNPPKPAPTKDPAPKQNPPKPAPTKDPAPKQNPPKPAPTKQNPPKPVPTKDPAPKQNPPKPAPTKDPAPKQNPPKPAPTKDPAPKQNPPKPVPTKDPAPKQNPPKPAPTKDPASKQNPPKPVPTKEPSAATQQNPTTQQHVAEDGTANALLVKIRQKNTERWSERAAAIETVTDSSKGLVTHGSRRGRWLWLPEEKPRADGESSQRTAISGPLASQRRDTIIVQGSGNPKWRYAFRSHGFTEYTPSSSACHPGGAQKDRPGNCMENFGYVEYLSDFDELHPVPEVVVFFHRTARSSVSQALGERLVSLIDKGVQMAKETGQVVSLTAHEVSPLRGDYVGMWNQLFHDIPHPAVKGGLPEAHPCLTNFVVPRTAILDYASALHPRYRTSFYTRLHNFMHYDSRSNAGFFRQIYALLFNATGYTVKSVVNEPGFEDERDLFLNSSCRPAADPETEEEMGRAVVKDTGKTMVYGENGWGSWVYRRDSKWIGKMVTVVGGTVEDAVYWLVQSGHVLWLPELACTSFSFDCRENYGYYSYMLDDDARKPVAEHTAFIHGHKGSWRHHRFVELTSLLEDGFRCSAKTNRFSPLLRVPYFQRGDRQHVAASWNSHFGRHRLVPVSNLDAFCCAQFVVSRPLLRAVSKPLVADLLMKAVTGGLFGGESAEYTYHILFNESVPLNLTEEVCEPDLPVAFNSFARTPKNASVPINALFKDRISVRYPPPAHGKPNVEVVIGMEYPGLVGQASRIAKLAQYFTAGSRAVWVRRPQRGTHGASNTEIKGYVTYFVYDIPRLEFAVFVHGNETDLPALDRAVSAAIAVASKSPFGFTFIDYAEPSDQQMPSSAEGQRAVCDKLNAVWAQWYVAGALSAVRRCGGPGWNFPPFTPSDLPSLFGTRFVVRTDKTLRHACATAVFQWNEYDFKGADMHVMAYLWKRLFVPADPARATLGWNL
ncbi:Cell surface glycoprotein 1 [Diplonema papillatum]|nr:Cell surface glycoprotein 1 [Diplonema papillatum]